MDNIAVLCPWMSIAHQAQCAVVDGPSRTRGAVRIARTLAFDMPRIQEWNTRVIVM